VLRPCQLVSRSMLAARRGQLHSCAQRVIDTGRRSLLCITELATTRMLDAANPGRHLPADVAQLHSRAGSVGPPAGERMHKQVSHAPAIRGSPKRI
jgi:hypothetical protein